jgi:hypothetical protein
LNPGLGAVLALGLVNCSSTGVGNPGIGSVSLAIVSDDEPEPSAVPGDAGSDEPLPRGALERAVLVLGSVRWLPCDTSQTGVVHEGPFIVDLLAGETRPPLPELDAPEGGVCGFDAPLSPARDSAQIGGRSLLFSGVRADGTEFLLFGNVRATLRVRAADGQTWGGDEPQALLWAMRPRRWAAQMELAEAEPSEWAGGRRIIVIDVNRHPLLYGLIRARLAGTSRVLIDQDGDGSLGEAERASDEIGTGTTDADE